MYHFFIALLGLWFCSCSAVFAQATPVIAVAGGIKLVIEEINQRFNEDTGLIVKLSFDSSGHLFQKITQQTENFELFLSADEQYPLKLAKQGLTLDQGLIYGLGRLVLFVPHGSPISVDSELKGLANSLKQGELTQFVIANPEHSPYGRAAKQALINAGLWETIQPQLNLANGGMQAARLVVFGELQQGGLFAHSLALSPWIKSQGHFALVSDKLSKPLQQRMVLLKNASQTAKAFYQYLQQPKARAVLNANGLLPP
jgi:molybdate transport system substrate-binding protein